MRIPSLCRNVLIGIGEALQDDGFRHDWRRTAACYRMFLYQDGGSRRRPGARAAGAGGLRGEEVEAVVEKGGAMSVREALRHRVRYFCNGAVLGTVEFVNGVFEQEQSPRRRFGEKRTTGARRMRGADWGDRGCCGICRRI